MPSSAYVQSVLNRSFAAVSYQTPASFRSASVLIGVTSPEALGGTGFGGPSSATYPAASRVLAFPFELGDWFLVQKVWFVNGTTTGTDSADVGVYSEDGATLIVHGGSTLTSGANLVQEIDCTDTLLIPGRYWCAYVQGGVTSTPSAYSYAAGLFRAVGCAQMAGSGSTLGATFTPAAIASGVFPAFGIAGRTQVA